MIEWRNVTFNPCPGCGKLPGSDNERVATRKDGLQVIRCFECRLVHVNPRPDANELDRYYAEGTVSEQMGAGYLERLDSTIAMGHYKCLNAIPEPSLGGALKEAKVLDVACAAGHMMLCLRRRNWSVYGVELSQELANVARRRYRLDNVCSSRSLAEITDWLNVKGPFQLITMMDILEHVEDIYSFMSFYEKHLAPGGRIVIATPNWPDEVLDSATLERMKTLHLSVILEHLSYLSINDIRRLADRLALDVEIWGTYGPSLVKDTHTELFKQRRIIRQKLEQIPFFSSIYWRLKRRSISAPEVLRQGDLSYLYMYAMLKKKA